ncbi:hypothetical protein G6F64_014200 [Rhizopus arrhizus]|uniref:Uncharacterized protein n=1 Tax=Rhizopus oryzae TaxID=64495 RepID=A0A9P6WU03_RHIOR|nr:hypothetical protein G6F64_014200 [Rhizopus arrhizus]
MQVAEHHHTTYNGLERRDPHEAAIGLRAVQSGDFQRLTFQRQRAALQHVRDDCLGRRIGAQLRAPEPDLSVHSFLDVVHGRSRSRGRRG